MHEHTDRVRQHTAGEVLRRIDDSTVANLTHYAEVPTKVGWRLIELGREWDTDRMLETEAAISGLMGLAASFFVRRELISLPAVVAMAVLVHAITGRYPLMPLFRRLGIRTAKEISRERYALKVLRGDFTGKAPRDAALVLDDDRFPPPTARRVELHTSRHLNDAIRRRTDAEVLRLERATPDQLEERLQVLAREWDIERLLQTNASLVVLIGLTLACKVSKKFLWLPAGVFTFFLEHALQGWCPPIPVFRRLGVRTQREIERERYALKALRGDFDDVTLEQDAPVRERVRAALAAVDK